MRVATLCAIFMPAATNVEAATCISVSGQAGGTLIPAGVTRQVTVKSTRLTLSKVGEPGVLRLNCNRLAKGVWCEGQTSNGLLTIMTNETRIIEKANSPAGEEILGIAYVCDKPLK